MAGKGRSWNPSEPEAPDDDAVVADDVTLDSSGLADARVGKLVVASVPDARLVRIEAERLVAAGAVLPGLTARDVIARGGDLSNTQLAGATLRRVRASEIGGVGVDVSSARVESVALHQCKLRMARGLGVQMTKCYFHSCDFREAEFEGATLDRVVFRDCDLSGARLVGVDLSLCDLRGSRVDGLVVSPDRIRGVRVDVMQLPTFAAALGLDLGEAPRG